LIQEIRRANGGQTTTRQLAATGGETFETSCGVNYF